MVCSQQSECLEQANNILEPSDAIFNTGADNKTYLGQPSIGGWGEGSADKKRNVLIQPAK